MRHPHSQPCVNKICIPSERGYAIFQFLSNSDLQFARNLICSRVSKTSGKGITYDELLLLSGDALTNIICEKPNRMFSSLEIDQLMGLESLTAFFSHNSELSLVRATHPVLGQVEDFEVYFRIVSPGSGGTKSLGHIDWWYDDLYKIPTTDRPHYKIWISINTEPLLNGLLLKKISPEKYNYRAVTTPHGRRPEMDEPPDLSFYDFPPILPGEAIIFESQKVLHLGAPNNGKFNRISLEISIKPTAT